MADTRYELLSGKKATKDMKICCKQCFSENGGCFPGEINCFYEGCDDLPENEVKADEDNQDEETMQCPFCKTEVNTEGCYYFGTPGIACYECGSIIEV